MQIENFKWLHFSTLTKASSLVEVSESITSNKYLHDLVFKINVCSRNKMIWKVVQRREVIQNEDFLGNWNVCSERIKFLVLPSTGRLHWFWLVWTVSKWTKRCEFFPLLYMNMIILTTIKHSFITNIHKNQKLHNINLLERIFLFEISFQHTVINWHSF